MLHKNDVGTFDFQGEILHSWLTSGSFFFMGGGCRPFWKMINIFAYTSPNRSGVGAIDNPDRFEQVFDTYYIPETSEKIFMDDISMVRP